MSPIVPAETGRGLVNTRHADVLAIAPANVRQ
jgi:hypothetical protein